MAKTCSQRQKRAYKDAYNRIVTLTAELQNEVLYNGGVATRTQLWQYVKYRQLMVEIEKQAGMVGANQISALDVLMEQVFLQTIGSTIKDITGKSGSFNALSDGLAKQFVNTNWAGSNYSSRVWNNTNTLASRLKDDLSDMMLRGRSPTDIKKRLQSDLNVSYSVADRLIRTESAHVYNEAALEGYKAANVKKLKILIGHDERTCERCSANVGEYEIGTEPMLPTHPNCRCCYAPVVELPTVKELSTVEMRALNQYVSAESYTLNDKLRSGGRLSNRERNMVRDLDNALNKMVDYEGTVYRSISSQMIQDVDAFNAEYRVGGIVLHKGYTSTSTSIYDDSMDIQMIIESKHGKDIRAINPGEQEVLFKRNVTFKVTKREGDTIWLTEM